VSRFTDTIIARKHGHARENAGNVLKNDGSSDKAIVALGISQLHFILNHPTGGSDTLSKAADGFNA
jgi:hypothetical protein